MNRRTFVVSAASALSWLALSGCSLSRFISAQDPLPPHIGLVVPLTDHPYWVSCISGAQDIAALEGIDLHVLGPSGDDDYVAELPAYLNQAIDHGPQVILVYAGLETLTEPLERAKELGVPVIAIDSDALDPAHRVAYVGIDSYAAGFDVGRHLFKSGAIEANGTWAALVTSDSSDHEREVLSGMRDALLDHSIELVTSVPTNNTIESAEVTTDALLTDHPDLDMLFTCGTYNLAGAGNAKVASGSTVSLAGFDDVEENLAHLRSGVACAVVAQNPKRMGERAVEVALTFLQRHGAENKTFYDTGIEIITPETVETYTASYAL